MRLLVAGEGKAGITGALQLKFTPPPTHQSHPPEASAMPAQVAGDMVSTSRGQANRADSRGDEVEEVGDFRQGAAADYGE